MDALMSYVKPELLVVSAVLYFIGTGLKQSQTIKDKYIPLLLGSCGILICGIYVFSTCNCQSLHHVLMAIFTAVTQGILVAGLSTYIHQILKQMQKKE